MITTLRNPDDMIAWLCDGREPMEASISVAKLAALVSKALVEDGLEHDCYVVLHILLETLGGYDEMANESDIVITAATVFRYGSDWIVSIAEHLGFAGETDGAVDTAWMEGRPHIKAVWQALTRVSVQAMSAAAELYEQQHGHSMMEVFMASCETGEDFDQSKTRLMAQRQGLRSIH